MRFVEQLSKVELLSPLLFRLEGELSIFCKESHCAHLSLLMAEHNLFIAPLMPVIRPLAVAEKHGGARNVEATLSFLVAASTQLELSALPLCMRLASHMLEACMDLHDRTSTALRAPRWSGIDPVSLQPLGEAFKDKLGYAIHFKISYTHKI